MQLFLTVLTSRSHESFEVLCLFENNETFHGTAYSLIIIERNQRVILYSVAEEPIRVQNSSKKLINYNVSCTPFYLTTILVYIILSQRVC